MFRYSRRIVASGSETSKNLVRFSKGMNDPDVAADPSAKCATAIEEDEMTRSVARVKRSELGCIVVNEHDSVCWNVEGEFRGMFLLLNNHDVMEVWGDVETSYLVRLRVPIPMAEENRCCRKLLQELKERKRIREEKCADVLFGDV